MTYDMPSNEQRLDYLDNPERAFTTTKEFVNKMLQRKKWHEKKSIVLSNYGKEVEVPFPRSDE